MVGRIERGNARPSIESIEKLADAFGVEPAVPFGAAAITGDPRGECERALSRILIMLADRSEAEVPRAEKVLSAALDK